MKRTGEMALGIIGSIFNVLVIILISIMMMFISTAAEDTTFQDGLRTELENNPTLSAEDLDVLVDDMPYYLNAFGWVGIIVLLASTVFGILGIVFIKKDGKQTMAGTFFILAGVFSGVISITAILFYIAAIMSFVRKPKVEEIDTFYVNE
ncbi:DUF4064 domain-containing protein [Viridibacillus sp. YIM B01967]|uniref:DUF4064 domain-containing protein n=1 Tax=Viridibacillus soli TaxID=2798301 RepID=A0ABS1H548_9BACL|nr:DUF4064 domain-containing protein [Viridibacillus soli]MBK3494542.1 DUF4064 domain-containing protein [Viridibacillus soli]